MASFNCAIASDTAYLIGNRNAIILSHAVTCIVSLPVLRGAKKNGGDKRDVTRERRGTMVWHIALSSPRRRSDLTADLRIADLPSYTYLRLRSMSSFLRRTYHRAEFNEATISPNEKYERFHKAPRRSQVLRSAMVLDGVTTIDQWANLGESTTAPFAALEFSFWRQVMHSLPWYADIRMYLFWLVCNRDRISRRYTWWKTRLSIDTYIQSVSGFSGEISSVCCMTRTKKKMLHKHRSLYRSFCFRKL